MSSERTRRLFDDLPSALAVPRISGQLRISAKLDWGHLTEPLRIDEFRVPAHALSALPRRVMPPVDVDESIWAAASALGIAEGHALLVAEYHCRDAGGIPVLRWVDVGWSLDSGREPS
ncbi:MAG TPA: hypothetical protein VG265_16605 [Gaiellaceae bacterium]|jgi:hypothetical protein|nr:hypothetical protein [Gaiellaceae bacterium]